MRREPGKCRYCIHRGKGNPPPDQDKMIAHCPLYDQIPREVSYSRERCSDTISFKMEEKYKGLSIWCEKLSD
jgi:hypothetical protein